MERRDFQSPRRDCRLQAVDRSPRHRSAGRAGLVPLSACRGAHPRVGGGALERRRPVRSRSATSLTTLRSAKASASRNSPRIFTSPRAISPAWSTGWRAPGLSSVGRSPAIADPMRLCLTPAGSEGGRDRHRDPEAIRRGYVRADVAGGTCGLRGISRRRRDRIRESDAAPAAPAMPKRGTGALTGLGGTPAACSISASAMVLGAETASPPARPRPRHPSRALSGTLRRTVPLPECRRPRRDLSAPDECTGPANRAARRRRDFRVPPPRPAEACAPRRIGERVASCRRCSTAARSWPARFRRSVARASAASKRQSSLEAIVAGGKRIRLEPAPTIRCDLAAALARWVAEDVVPVLAAQSLVARRDRQRERLFLPQPQPCPGCEAQRTCVKGNAIDLEALVVSPARRIY